MRERWKGNELIGGPKEEQTVTSTLEEEFQLVIPLNIQTFHFD